MTTLLRVGLSAAAALVALLALAAGFAYYPAIAPVPPAPASLPPGAAGEPLARHVVVVVLDGARRDTFDDLVAARPTLASLRDRAAVFDGRSDLLTVSRPMYATLASGASPRLHGVATNSRTGPAPVDTVVAAARRAGLDVLLRDDRTSWWWDLFDATAAERATSGAQVMSRLGRPGRLLAYVHLLDPDEAAHAHGAASPAYAAALDGALDAVEALAAALDLSRDALVVTADHGHRDRGGHGGQEPEVVRVPLWVLGAGARAGRHGRASVSDVAPTVAALLGLSLPAHGEGRPLFEALSQAPGARAELAQRWLSQRWSLANALLGALGAPLLPPPVTEALLTPEAAAARVAFFAEATAHALGALDARERLWRGLALLPLVGALLWLLRRLRVGAAATGLALGGAGLFYGAWAGLLPFTLSALRDKGEFYGHLAALAAGTAAAVALVALSLARRGGDPAFVLRAGVAVLALGALEVGACFALYGMGLGSGLPPPEGFLLPALALGRLGAAAVAWGAVVPWLLPRALRRPGGA